jgi:hypothetical protein
MSNRVCGNCKSYQAEIEPDGKANGMGFCLSLATKQVGGEFRSPTGMVACSAPACSEFLSVSACDAVAAEVKSLLTPPRLPRGVCIERAIEVQSGKCLRQQDAMAAGPGALPSALDWDQHRICEVQLAAALANPQFFGRVSLVFGNTDQPALLSWMVRRYPPGGEIRT